MASAAGALGFGGGLAKGLASALLQNRERSDQQKREAEAAKTRQFQALNPVAFQAAQDTGDWATYEHFLTGYFPDLAKSAKKTGFSFQDLGPLLAPGGIQRPPGGAPTTGGAPSAGPAGLVSGTGEIAAAAALTPVSGGSPGRVTAAAAPDLPSRAAVAPTTPVGGPPSAPADPQSQFLGFSMLSPGQRREQAITEQTETEAGVATARVAVARRLLPALKQIDPSLTLEDALRYVSKGELVTPASRAASGSLYRYGVDREALSKALFDKPFENLTRQEADIIIREEQAMLQAESQARGTGTATARFNAPIDIPTAQSTGVDVGTRASDLAGQTVPTTAVRDRRRSVAELQENLQHIRENLLGVLPKNDDLGGLAPGAVYAVRRRLPRYRVDIAKLESAINNVVNVMARSVGEQRGTQTERDALRAEAAIAQIRDALLTGDTQESAQARIDQSLRVLDGILGQLPAEPTPTRPPATATPTTPGARPPATTPAPNAAPTATRDANGNWILP